MSSLQDAVPQPFDARGRWRILHDGPQALEAAAVFVPIVVLLDIGLPGLDGYGVVGALRRDPSTSNARMIAVTGYGGDEDRRRTQEAGFDRHLTKPVDPVALMAVLTPFGKLSEPGRRPGSRPES